MILLTLTACSSPSLIAIKGNEPHSHYKILANYNGQAELLLSLQIPPDYFPYQFKQRKLYDYLTNINKYLVTEGASQEKQELGKKLQGRIDQLISQVNTFGPSLWNEDLYAGGLVNRNVQYWNTKSADYLFLEQFIIDDSSDPLFLLERLPRHSHLAVTNFRAARDPYSLFGEDVYKYFGKPETNGANNQLAKKLHDYYRSYSKISPNNLFRSGKYIHFWTDFCKNLKEKSSDGTGKEDLKHFFKLPSFSNGKKEYLFAPFQDSIDKHIAKEFFEVIFSDEEKAALKNGTSEKFQFQYLKNIATQSSGAGEESICPSELGQSAFQKVHHPALEHQTLKGSSPVSEGTQKDLLVYLAQMAIALDKVSKTNNFTSVFGSDQRKDFISNAWKNAVSIAKGYRERLKNVREYLQAIGVVDTQFKPDQSTHTRNSSKTVAIVSYPPSQLGAGDATIQTISKYPFLYTELGLNEVIPNEWKNGGPKDDNHKDILGVDDNGWWWKLGDVHLSSDSLNSFSGVADSIILLATDDDWNILSASDSPKMRSLRSLLKSESNSNGKERIQMSNYSLWNEGLRSPIALNLLLDVLVDTLTKQFGNGKEKNGEQSKYTKALDWGDYWNKHFALGTNSTETSQK